MKDSPHGLAPEEVTSWESSPLTLNKTERRKKYEIYLNRLRDTMDDFYSGACIHRNPFSFKGLVSYEMP
uniref:Uncharacterized protein n=1 Tax=viral metagenome TaxID=1070528 RepID=A0A6M3JTB0_9ZZZZ